MQDIDLNDQTFRFGSETMRPMDSVNSIPGLLRGPASWTPEMRAISTFSPSTCVRILENDSRPGPDLIRRARAGIDAVVASRVGGDCWSAAAEKLATSGAAIVVVAPVSNDA